MSSKWKILAPNGLADSSYQYQYQLHHPLVHLHNLLQHIHTLHLQLVKAQGLHHQKYYSQMVLQNKVSKILIDLDSYRSA